jgi:hypothetical protein
MSSTEFPSALTALGYQVLSLELGVYVLQPSADDDDRVVALMLAASPPSGQELQVELYLEPVPADVAAIEIVEVWQLLDARRFEESGLTPRLLELGPIAPGAVEAKTYARPDGTCRHVLELQSGDVVCLN